MVGKSLFIESLTIKDPNSNIRRIRLSELSAVHKRDLGSPPMFWFISRKDQIKRELFFVFVFVFFNYKNTRYLK